jgi:hypothetical protein
VSIINFARVASRRRARENGGRDENVRLIPVEGKGVEVVPRSRFVLKQGDAAKKTKADRTAGEGLNLQAHLSQSSHL